MNLFLTSEPATEKTISLMEDLVKQLAHIKFEGVLLAAVLMLAAAYICLEGYGIYRMALGIIGFAVGYSHTHQILDLLHVQLSDYTFLVIQAAIGLICAGLAYTVLQAGIFIAAYHFVQANLASILVGMLAQKAKIPEIVYPIFAAFAGIGVAILLAKFAVKSERLVVVALTATIGGFATVTFFRQMIPGFPVNIDFLLRVPEPVWYGAKLFLSAAGFLVQGAGKEPA